MPGLYQAFAGVATLALFELGSLFSFVIGAKHTGPNGFMGHGIFDLIPSAEELAAIFSHAAAPAFLLAGVAGFISVLMTRLNVVVDRIRSLSEIPDDDPMRGRQKAQIPTLKRRAVLLHRAAFSALMAGISTTLLLMLSVATALLRLQHLFGGVLLFGVAAAMLSLALFRFAQEVRVALHELEQF